MVKLGMTADFKHQVLQWDGATVNMKESSGLLGKSDINKRDMREVVMQTTELVPPPWRSYFSRLRPRRCIY